MSIDEMFALQFSREDLDALAEALKDMKDPVTIYTFVGDHCRYCTNTARLIDILAEASPSRKGSKLIRHVILHKGKDSELFEKFKIERVPTVTMLEGHIRYIGMPAGEEIRGLVETIIRISTGESGLSKETIDKLKLLKGTVHVEVIVTPTCPYCPYSALLANMFAFESYRIGNRKIIADTVEAYENPDIADRYGVMSVPTIALNGEVEFIGVPYEENLIEKIIEKSEKSWVKEEKSSEWERILKDYLRKLK
jgi:glutaredoxin-like protein